MTGDSGALTKHHIGADLHCQYGFDVQRQRLGEREAYVQANCRGLDVLLGGLGPKALLLPQVVLVGHFMEARGRSGIQCSVEAYFNALTSPLSCLEYVPCDVGHETEAEAQRRARKVGTRARN